MRDTLARIGRACSLAIHEELSVHRAMHFPMRPWNGTAKNYVTFSKARSASGGTDKYHYIRHESLPNHPLLQSQVRLDSISHGGSAQPPASPHATSDVDGNARKCWSAGSSRDEHEEPNIIQGEDCGEAHTRCRGHTGTEIEPREHSDAIKHNKTHLASGDLPGTCHTEDQ